MRNQFVIVYHSRVAGHLRSIERKHHSLIREVIAAQLSQEPDLETRNRKPLLHALMSEATWEIRFGPNNRFRVFYEVDRAAYIVSILAIGEKHGNQLFIAGKEVAE